MSFGALNMVLYASRENFFGMMEALRSGHIVGKGSDTIIRNRNKQTMDPSMANVPYKSQTKVDAGSFILLHIFITFSE